MKVLQKMISYRLLSTSNKGVTKNMSPINLMTLSDAEKQNFLASFNTVITDCDGVLWHSKIPVPGAQEVMNILPSLNKQRYFFTNNSTQTRKQYIEKFASLGFDAFEDQVLSTAWLTAQYLKNQNFDKKVYLITSVAVEEELNNVGIRNLGTGPDPFVHKSSTPDNRPEVEMDPEVGAVVVGYDYHFSYPKIVKACSYLEDPDCLFIATNTDERFPVREGYVAPGAGSFVAAIERCAERTPLIIGKPSTLAIDSVLIPNGIDPKKCLMIGDRCNTDIAFGNQRGMTTLLVETGVHNLKNVKEYEASNMKHLVPTYYTSSIADLLKVLKL